MNKRRSSKEEERQPPQPSAAMARKAAEAQAAGGCLIKANSLRLGESGVLIYGAAGAGKSALTLALLERAALFGRSAALIGDDYSLLRQQSGAIYAEAPPHIAGALEIRGAGIFQTAYERRVRLALAVELAGAGERYPQGHQWHWPQPQSAPAQIKAAAPQPGSALPLLKLPQAGKADILALCHAVEAWLFKRPIS